MPPRTPAVVRHTYTICVRARPLTVYTHSRTAAFRYNASILHAMCTSRTVKRKVRTHARGTRGRYDRGTRPRRADVRRPSDVKRHYATAPKRSFRTGGGGACRNAISTWEQTSVFFFVWFRFIFIVIIIFVCLFLRGRPRVDRSPTVRNDIAWAAYVTCVFFITVSSSHAALRVDVIISPRREQCRSRVRRVCSKLNSYTA